MTPLPPLDIFQKIIRFGIVTVPYSMILTRWMSVFGFNVLISLLKRWTSEPSQWRLSLQEKLWREAPLSYQTFILSRHYYIGKQTSNYYNIIAPIFREAERISTSFWSPKASLTLVLFQGWGKQNLRFWFWIKMCEGYYKTNTNA